MNKGLHVYWTQSSLVSSPLYSFKRDIFNCGYRFHRAWKYHPDAMRNHQFASMSWMEKLVPPLKKMVNTVNMGGKPYLEPTPFSTRVHGNISVNDGFHFVQELNQQNDVSSPVRHYLKQENQFFKKFMKKNDSLYQSIYRDVCKLLEPKTDGEITSFEISEGYLYLTLQLPDHVMPIYARISLSALPSNVQLNQCYFEELKRELMEQYSADDHHRSPTGSAAGRFELVLHPREVRGDPGHFQLLSVRLSPCQNFISYTYSTDYGNTYKVKVKHIMTKTIIDEITHCSVLNTEFSHDAKIMFYTVADPIKKRPFKVVRHVIGNGIKCDDEIFRDEDETFFVDISMTKDKEFITLYSNNKTTSEARIIPTDKPDSMHLVHPREEGLIYFVEHNQGNLYITNNSNHHQAGGYCISRTSVSTPGREHWETIIDTEPHIVIEDMDMYKDHIVLFEKCNSFQRIEVVHLNHESNDMKRTVVKLPEEISTVDPGMNHDFHASKCYLTYSSIITPPVKCDIDLNTAQIEISASSHEAFPKWKSEDFVTRRVYVTSKYDKSIEIPMTIVHNKDIQYNSMNPTLLFGYGAYGHNLEVDFQPHKLLLLSQGFILAFCHCRGGSEMGNSWYEGGKKLNKKNSFEDFISCAEYLVNEGYTNPKLLCARGASAGGLLVASSMNLRPDLFRSVIMKVPFLDITNIMMNPDLPLTEHERDEWGDPISDRQVFEYIHSYSPYDNLEKAFSVAKSWPHLFITASLNDFLAPCWNVAKYVALTRHLQRKQPKDMNDFNILFRTSTAGHSDHHGTLGDDCSISQEFTFLFNSLGLEWKSSTIR